jgi:hypothetical protein
MNKYPLVENSQNLICGTIFILNHSKGQQMSESFFHLPLIPGQLFSSSCVTPYLFLVLFSLLYCILLKNFENDILKFIHLSQHLWPTPFLSLSIIIITTLVFEIYLCIYLYWWCNGSSFYREMQFQTYFRSKCTENIICWQERVYNPSKITLKLI